MVITGTNLNTPQRQKPEIRYAYRRTLSFRETILRYPSIVVSAIFLLIGVLIGVLLSGSISADVLKRLDVIFCSDFQGRLMQPLAQIFVSSASSCSIFVVLCFLFGMALWGRFFIPLLPLIRGIGIGFISGYLYATFALKGILFYLLVLLPGILICIFGILLAAKEAMYFSKQIIQQISPKTEDKQTVRLSGYFTHFGIVMIFPLACAAMDTLTTLCFAGWFSF